MRILSILLLLSITACSSSKQTNKSIALNPSHSISLERTACYGTCPVYKVIIFADGTVLYKGDRNVTHVGSYTGEIAKQEAQALFAKIANYSWEDYPDKYPIDNYDFPQFNLEYSTGETSKLVKANTNAAAELIALSKHIDKLIDALSLKKD